MGEVDVVHRLFRLIAAAVLFLAVACSDDGDQEVDEDGRSGPGTELGDGFEVPEGTELLGAVWPGVTGEDEDTIEALWSADLLITGSILDVQQALKRQVLANDLALGAGCYVGDGVVDCSISGGRNDGANVVESVNVHLQQTTGDARGWADHAELRYVRYIEGEGPEESASFGGASPLESVPPGTDPPPQPGVGEPIAEDQYAYDNPPVVLVEGSTLVAPVRTYDDCTGGFTAHLLIPADAEAVVADYRRQLDAWDFVDGGPATTQEFRGREVLHDGRYTSGGGDLTLDVRWGEGDEPTVARLRRCND